MTDTKLSKALAKGKKGLPILLLALPGLIYLFINNYMPMAGMVVAFKTYSGRKGIWGSPWAGLSNFRYLFMTKDALIITRNTLLYNLAFIGFDTTLAVTIAILLSKVKSSFKRQVYQSAILLPHLISMVIVSYIVYGFLSVENGFVNHALFASRGLEGISWYSEPGYWPFIIVLVHCWAQVGYTCIVYYATIIGIDQSYYEAASLEGAGQWKQVTSITIPLLRPLIITMVMLAVGKIFYSDFSLFYQVPMNSGALYSTTQVIDTYVYRGLLEQGNISMSAAAGVYQSIVGFIVVLTCNMLLRKFDSDNAVF